MIAQRFIFVGVISAFVGCSQPQHAVPPGKESEKRSESHLSTKDDKWTSGKEALLLTHFDSFEAFKEVVQVQYASDLGSATEARPRKPQVVLTYRSGNREVTSILITGISQSDFMRARVGTWWDRVRLGVRTPYALFHKSDLVHVENLGRRRPWVNGQGDVAFYDLAETMVKNIRAEDTLSMSPKELSEKGYLNTFNHITAQAFMTSLYAERLADFVADVHERYNMPELITGNFTADQLADVENGPVDNYVDMINNELGQELGKELREKYSICRKTYWTPELVRDYLNDIQGYHSWVFQIGFIPFRSSDEMVIRFAAKLNNRSNPIP